MSTRLSYSTLVLPSLLTTRGPRGAGALVTVIALLAACGGAGGGSTDDVGAELGGSDACSVDCVDTTSDVTGDTTGPDTSDQDTAPDDTDPTPDDATTDTDAADPDTSSDTTPDAHDEDTTAPDTTEPDTTEPDTTDVDDTDADASTPHDTSDATDDTRPGETCATEPFIDLDFAYVRCAESYTGLRRWVPTTEGSTCPPYFTLLGDRYDTAEEALAAKACDTDCTWAPSNSFTVLRCGRRTGYILYRAEDAETCGDLYEFPEGLYPTIEAHDQAHPCPPEE